MIGVFSRGILRIPNLAAFLGEEVRACSNLSSPRALSAVAGWGLKPTARRARAFAARQGLPYLGLEDGFLRSFGLAAAGASPLSLVVDDLGVYYDATRPSRLEQLLNEGPFSPALLAEAERALELLRREGLSKYNQALDAPAGVLGEAPGRRVLVVDQTAGDASIRYGLASESTFGRMLEAARGENPDATIFVKTHPDVLAGKKRGCLDPRAAPTGVRWIAEDWHPHSLLAYFDRVYVVTSQMGLDALLVGKPVTCFGMPFYAGWGLTDDRAACPRRTARRTLPELVVAGFIAYPRYVRPETGSPGTFFDVAEFVARQKRMARVIQGRVFCLGFQYWKRAHVRPFFGSGARPVFVRDVAQARAIGIQEGEAIAVWGQRDTPEVQTLAETLGSPLWRVEDGFVRSVGLGSDFVPPLSLALDRRGIYFDPSRACDLERLLNGAELSATVMERAKRVRAFICANRITKYNVDDLRPLQLRNSGSLVVLVPGQVEGDASIIKGAGSIRTNAALLQRVRERRSDAFVVYKPHPDVLAWNRRGWLRELRNRGLCDHVETRLSVVSCIEAADEVHTMTSLAGFDALLRGRPVFTYGSPFYAGWGLTEDEVDHPTRRRRLTLDELVASALLLYPRYWDPKSGGFVDVETILQRIVDVRDSLFLKGKTKPRCCLPHQMKRLFALMGGLWAAFRSTA